MLARGKLLMHPRSSEIVWDHRILCTQVPYKGLMQPRGFGVAAQVMMRVESGQVYFGKCHTSDLISPLHETHSWLLLAWSPPSLLTLSCKGNNILLHSCDSGAQYNLPCQSRKASIASRRRSPHAADQCTRVETQRLVKACYFGLF